MTIDTGLEDNARKAIAEELKRVLADSYALYVKTQNYHWNVTGPLFKSVHDMTEAQYMALATANDDIAERIRALGVKAPGGYKAFSELSGIADGDENLPADKMIGDLVKGHEHVVKSARKAIEIADTAGDEATVDLLVTRLEDHEKQAWMLRSLNG